MSSTTVVTCLFDLTEREPGGVRRSAADYLEQAEALMALDADLVVFTDPQLTPTLQAAREQRGRSARTNVIPCPLESLRSYARLRDAELAREQHPLHNAGPPSETPLHAVVTWARFELLARALELDAFGADHHIWVDFGLWRTAKTDHCREDRVFSSDHDGVRLLQMQSVDRSILVDPAFHLGYRRGTLSPAMIAASNDRLAELARVIEHELDATLAGGFAPLDEHLLELATIHHPDLFTIYYGAYDHITENYTRPRGSGENLAGQLRGWRFAGDWQSASSLASQVVSSVREQTFDADPPTLAALLEECFLAAYYAHDPDHSEALAIASLYAERAHTDADFRDHFLLNELRIRNNFAFVELAI